MDQNFRPDQSKAVQEAEKTEFSFEEGVAESIRRIQELFRTLNRDVYVVINGSDIDVGKSALLGALHNQLIILGIPTTHVKELNHPGKEKEVILLTQQGMIYKIGESYRDFLLKTHPDRAMQFDSFADLYIGIYRPDKAFDVFLTPEKRRRYEPVADIMIRNEQAKDDLGKLRQKL